MSEITPVATVGSAFDFSWGAWSNGCGTTARRRVNRIESVSLQVRGSASGSPPSARFFCARSCHVCWQFCLCVRVPEKGQRTAICKLFFVRVVLCWCVRCFFSACTLSGARHTRPAWRTCRERWRRRWASWRKWYRPRTPWSHTGQRDACRRVLLFSYAVGSPQGQGVGGGRVNRVSEMCWLN